MTRDLWIAFGTLVVTIIGTGIGVGSLVVALHSEVRSDLRRLDDRLRRLEVAAPREPTITAAAVDGA